MHLILSYFWAEGLVPLERETPRDDALLKDFGNLMIVGEVALVAVDNALRHKNEREILRKKKTKQKKNNLGACEAACCDLAAAAIAVVGIFPTGFDTFRLKTKVL